MMTNKFGGKVRFENQKTIHANNLCTSGLEVVRKNENFETSEVIMLQRSEVSEKVRELIVCSDNKTV